MKNNIKMMKDNIDNINETIVNNKTFDLLIDVLSKNDYKYSISYVKKLNKIIYTLNSYNLTINNNYFYKIFNKIFPEYITQKYIDSVYKKIDSLNDLNVQEYLNIITDININKLVTLLLFSKENQLLDISISENLKPVESIISQYNGYVFRKKSKSTLKESYDNDIVKEIEDESSILISYVKKINEIIPNFFDDNDSLIDLAFNIKGIAESENGFFDIVNYVYKALYESSGTSNNRIYLISEENKNEKMKNTMDLIKHLRNCFDHSSHKTDKKHKKVFDNYKKEKLGFTIGLHKKDWIKLQLAFYKDLNIMLETIINYISK